MARPRPGRHSHDGHGHGCDGRDTATATTWPRSHTKERARAIPHDSPKHNRTNVPMLHHATNTPVGECPPGSKSRGRWVSGLKAECDFRGYLEKLGHGATGWNGAVFAVLASGGASRCGIFSCCNRCCTLHIVYNVPWIDVDDGRAQLGSASISGCYHSLRVA